MPLAPRPSPLAPRPSPVVVEHVWKRYQRGLQHHSLRDAIPALVKGWLNGRRDEAALAEGQFWALQDVSFEVAQGETLGIIGRNGAGKSTVLKLLSGITKQTKGGLKVRGRLAALIEVGAGFHPDLTGRENVYLNGAILGLKRREVRALFDRIVAFAELEDFIDTPVKRYSSGMFVRLGFAVAAHLDPDVLLIDEVLAVGDLPFQHKCLSRIHEMKRMGKTIVFISHNLNAVQRICDRAILLGGGRIAAEGRVADVIRAYRERVLEKERARFHRAASRVAQDGDGGRRSSLRVEAVGVCGDGAPRAETIESGRHLSVEVRYACARRIERPVVSVSIERLDGLVCHVASTGRGPEALPALEGRGVVRLTYPELNLLPNTYGISVEVTEEGRATPLDSRKFAAMFTVVSEDNEAGVVRLAHEWQLRAAEPEELSPEEPPA